VEAAARDDVTRRPEDPVVPCTDRHADPPSNRSFGWCLR
jgi:hypothetical protein